MPDLYPEVLNMIEAGPQSICDHYVEHIPVMRNESLEEFARRIALRAVELEREECAKVCESRAGSGPYAESMGAHRILTSAADAIRRRGKP